MVIRNNIFFMRLAYNVCVSVVVAYRSRVLSHEEKRYRINVLNTLMSRHHYRNILLSPVRFHRYVNVDRFRVDRVMNGSAKASM